MATAPSERGPVRGRLDGEDRLISADPELVTLQTEAGSHVGSELALPQILSIARLARKLGVPIYRNALAAGADQDVEMGVRAIPDGNDVDLTLERLVYRPPAAPRLGTLVPHEQQIDLGGAPEEWATNEDLSIVSISPGLAEKLGTTPEEAIGKPLTRLLKLEENEDGELPLLLAATSRSDFDGQRARPRHGADEVLTLRGTPVSAPDGRFAGFQGDVVGDFDRRSGSSVDSSELDQLIDEALRSPLDRIIESADRIVQQSEGPLRSDYADYAGDIAAAARHLLSVIRSMNGEGEGEQDRVDLVALGTEAGGMLETTAHARRVRIALDPSAPIGARGDSRGIIQILVNLIGNAVRHSPAGSTVTLSFESSDGKAQAHVIDQGPGIDPADQERIFERFERVKGGEGGTGLGLAIARRLAHSMGGDIELQSAPGEGSRFTLILPAA
ncbi:PAS domain-containing sensor histidine kinase [Sphingomonas sp. SM33]|uniref:histidine kinase n=1 Tax=Sphingomonas telluris TaxID=2907998 RepID=A0ABS9VJQ1_9SPHN|nr:PAS domain-containing sensor histidine kinase [Sphingomonas telluris]